MGRKGETKEWNEKRRRGMREEEGKVEGEEKE